MRNSRTGVTRDAMFSHVTGTKMASEKPSTKPSDQLKARLGAELLAEVDSMGRMARRLCETSQSQQVRTGWTCFQCMVPNYIWSGSSSF